MARFKSLADQADSQEAICDYMYYREENKYMHRARVLISSCGKNQYKQRCTRGTNKIKKKR